MKKLIFVAIVLILLFVSKVIAQEPGDILWTNTYGGISSDKGAEVQLTSDDGYIITGRTASFGAGARDAYLIKTNANGDTLWTKTYGGLDWDYAYSVQQTTDSGFIVVGGSRSFSSGGDYDVYLIKTDVNGDTLWTRTYGGTNLEYGSSIQLTSDGGYIIIGVTMSFGAGDRDFYLLKIDATGDTLWTKTFGGTGSDEGYSVQLTSDGGYIIVGETCSYGVPTGTADVWLIKTDSDGNLLWSQTYGGIYTDFGNSIQLTSDDGYIVAGGTWSYGAGYTDAYLIKTDANGDTLWTKAYGNTSYDTAFSIQQTADGGYIFTGDYEQADNTCDVWIVKTDEYGNTVWEEMYGEAGGWNYDVGASIQLTSDNNYIIAGQTYSYGAGDWDVWMLKIESGYIPQLNPPQNLFVTELGYATWDAPASRDLLGYNVYLNGDIVEYTTDLFYQYTNLTNGQNYLAGVSAVYDEGESEIIDFEFTFVLDPPQNLAVACIEDHAHFTWETPAVDARLSKEKVKTSEENTRDLTGYIVYLDQEEVATNIPDLEYDFYDLISGNYYDAGVKAIYDEGTSELVEINFQYTGTGVENILPLITELKGNYPNPFNPTTIISFSISQISAYVNLDIYNIKGQKVKQLVSSQLSDGKHSVVWDGKDENGKSVTSGIYFYKMKAGKFTSTKKMILLK